MSLKTFLHSHDKIQPQIISDVFWRKKKSSKSERNVKISDFITYQPCTFSAWDGVWDALYIGTITVIYNHWEHDRLQAGVLSGPIDKGIDGDYYND